MSIFKGTKGPWQHLGDPEDGECRVRQTASVKHGPGFYSEITICENITSLKNAALIAAAPELLEALVIAVGNLKEVCDVLGCDRPQSTIRRAEAAIAKALGEAK